MNENKSEFCAPFECPVFPEAMLLAEISRISTNDRGEPLSWGATPLIMSPDTKLQQDAVKDVIGDLFSAEHVTAGVSARMAEYIEDLNMARTVNRESHNTDSFIYRGKTNLDGIPLEALEVFNRATKGFASPAELLFISKLLSIPTIELASLTHPYGQRIEQLGEMRAAVNEAIELMGGTLVRGVRQDFEVKGSDNLRHPEAMEGLHMTRKTLFGQLPDGTEIIERSSFVLLIDQIPANIATEIRSIPYGELWSKQVRRAGELYKLVPMLLSSDERHKAVPISTTVVAINERLSKGLLTREAMHTRRRQYLAAHASKI